MPARRQNAMGHAGHRILPAGRATVWHHLTSAQSLALCIPGCERVTGDVTSGFEMVVSRKLGPINLQFAGTIELSEVVPARSVVLTGHGKGGVAGLAEGRARIALSDHPDGTEITWDLGAALDGKVTRLGRRPIEGAVATMTERFVDRLDALLRGDMPADPA